jgi:hypothetical protein
MPRDRSADLERLGLGRSSPPPPESPLRFPDGGAFRVEIPSVETPPMLAAVIESAKSHGLTVNRVSQGGGATLLTAAELHEMSVLACSHDIDLAVFVGPRAGFDIGAFSRSPIGPAQYASIRGSRQLAYAVEDVLRATEAGVRSFLLGDIGLLWVLTELRSQGRLPADCKWKISAYTAPSNGATLRVLETLGAATVNVATDLTLEELADMRAAVQLPIDVYLEAPDAMGGIVRGHEIGDVIAVAAPVYTKFGLRNAPSPYPAGAHNHAVGIAMCEARVRRAVIALEWLARTRPEAVQSPGRA